MSFHMFFCFFLKKHFLPSSVGTSCSCSFRTPPAPALRAVVTAAVTTKHLDPLEGIIPCYCSTGSVSYRPTQCVRWHPSSLGTPTRKAVAGSVPCSSYLPAIPLAKHLSLTLSFLSLNKQPFVFVPSLGQPQHFYKTVGLPL